MTETIVQALSIAGRVIDSRTQQPILNAKVEIIESPPAFQSQQAWNPPEYSVAYTRPDGSYYFTNLPDGAYKLRASAEARYGSTVTGNLNVSQTRLPNGRLPVAQGDITLVATAIHGRITGAGQPLSGIQHNVRIHLQGDTVYVASGGDGNYRLENLLPGKVTVEATAKNFRPATKTVTLTAGQDQVVDLALQTQ